MEFSKEELQQQLLEATNKLIGQSVKECKERIYLDVVSERSDYYESLHNYEQKLVYELQLENVELCGKLEQYETLIEEYRENDIYGMGIKQIFRILLSKIKHRLFGRG